MKEDDILRLDVRLQEKNLETGVLTPKELEKYLKNLPDVSEKSEKLGGEESSPEEDEPGNDQEIDTTE